MGSSINTLSLHYPTRIHAYPQFKKHFQNTLHLDQIFKISPKPISIISYFNKPTSYYPLITSSSSPHKEFTKFMSEKIVTLLVGSFIFMGFFNKKPVLAQPSQSHSQTESQSFDFDEEEMMYMKLLDGNPKDVEILKSVFNAKMKRGKTKEAIEYVERLIAIEPKEVEWRLLQALCYEMIGDYNKAKNLFKNILKERPLLLRALHGLAMVMHKNLEGPAVFEMLNKSLEIAHQTKKVADERNIRILIAQMHVVKGELDDALKLFKDLIDENPRDFRPYLCQGIIYSLLDRKEEAEEQFLIYQSLLPDEFPQRGFLDDVVLAAKTEIRQQNKKGLKPEFLYKK
ncbi:protein SLOW GREEN 1, chloroplastic [Rutidosis leptorrhynchoides]|uniref:protein SLOW GREEN 1, chloroplastic n=1 Tax=Rutidosis leptorrhynchoides TaxID=125765 RepID=UPI003A9995D8